MLLFTKVSFKWMKLAVLLRELATLDQLPTGIAGRQPNSVAASLI